jgi:hypothetical protein
MATLFDPISNNTLRALAENAPNLASNSVAPRETISAIDTAASAPNRPLNGLDLQTRSRAYLALAISAAHNGSSDKIKFPGNLAIPAPDNNPAPVVRADDLVRLIRKHCTLRQFCMFYAKLVWNSLLLSDEPPANWARRGHAHGTRFAAFDFFDGVTHPSALDPEDGLIRDPTHDELIAHQAARSVSIFRDLAKRGSASNTQVEFTGGRAPGTPATLRLPPPPPS